MELELLKYLEKVIFEKFDINVYNLNLSLPPKVEFWDYALWCHIFSKDLKKNPNIIATELKEILDKEINNNKNDSIIESINIAWPYLNIIISKKIFTNKFNEIYNDKENYLKTNIWDWKNIIVDYIWANVWKPLHIWHMCSPNQGQVIVKLYKKLWYNVISDSHIGDWWIIFWKLILAYKLWWNDSKLKEDAVNYLLELYIKITDESEEKPELEQKIRDEFKLLSSWNKKSIDLWYKFTRYSIDAMNIQLDRLNIKSDYNIWESFYEWLDLPKLENYPDLKYDMKNIVWELIEKDIATKNNDNSVWVVFDDDLKMPSCILQKRDWTHGYLASDLASIKYRIENWKPEKIIYFVDVRQQTHLRQAFIISIESWWVDSTELIHASNWFISLKDWAMSTRKWRIIKLDKLLDEAEERAKKIILEKRDDISWEELTQLSKIIWIWAIKYGYLKKSREIDVIFDWDEFMSFEWNSWPYIQYAFVRARKIIENYYITVGWSVIGTQNMDIHKLGQFKYSEEVELFKQIMNYKDILLKTSDTNMPHYLCKYAYDLTKKFNSFYNNIHILNEKNNDDKIIRLKLIDLFSIILKECFEILCIEMPKKM